MCLVRVLLQKKIIKSDQKVAIINTDFNDAGITWEKTDKAAALRKAVK